MRCSEGQLAFSSADLSNFLGCRHLAELDRAVAEGRLEAPTRRDPGLVLLQERGLAHELAYVDSLKHRGLRVLDVPAEGEVAGLDRTRQAMAEGYDAIVQAMLGEDRWSGRADVLLRVERASTLGSWSYEVADTKLAQTTRGATILQLLVYSDLLTTLQGTAPEYLSVVKPGPDFPTDRYRTDEFAAYGRELRRRFETAMAERSDTYPLPVGRCDTCRWWSRCDRRWHDDDHLVLVAGIQTLHVAELERQGLPTLEAFASLDSLERPRRGQPETYERLQRQAQVQLASRRQGRILHEFRPVEPGRGLARLPAPSPGDLFFDIEADPFVDDGGIEYLLGVAWIEADGSLAYRGTWGLDRAAERRAFEELMDFFVARLEEHPDLHVYHFSPYEPAALKRLMGRFGSREDEVDRLLRGERLVDLLAVVRQGLWVGVESYSLKALEPCFGFARQVPLRQAAAALQRVARGLELTETVSDSDRQLVETYNREDCLATAALRDWLEARRSELASQGVEVPRLELLDGEASEKLMERLAPLRATADRLRTDLPDDPGEDSEAERAIRLLANQLEYFHREDKAAWWEVFRLQALDDEALFAERKAVAGLVFLEELPRESPRSRVPIHRYGFPPQEVALRVSTKLRVGEDKLGTVHGIDQVARTLDIKKRGDTATLHPTAVHAEERISPTPLDTSLLAFARSVVEHGLGEEGPGTNGRGDDAPYRALRDLLLRRRPRGAHPASGPLRNDGEPVVEAARRLVVGLDDSWLAIQGPPGTGKSYTGARILVELARRGLRIGVTAVGHKVIRSLLTKTLEAAAEEGVTLEAIHKLSGDQSVRLGNEPPIGLTEARSNDEALESLGPGRVLGATAWLWARDEAEQSLDVLVVDEAGQMALAQVLAAGRSARNLVLLGDPQQLEQPQRSSHPGGAEVAALQHVLAGRPTMPDDLGLFLDETWRLAPAITDFTSEAYYEGRLSSRPELERQRLIGAGRFDGAGLFFVTVEHQGNQASSPEEVETVRALVDELLSRGARWVDREGIEHLLAARDLLVVAPFNAQVGALSGALPELRVGTVDRFQGQEAPVVIYSFASSSVEDAPRGLAFLLDPHRLNVATSRARCTVILVGSPRLFEVECREPDAMRRANGLCRYAELARIVDP